MSVELLNESGVAVDEHRLLGVARHALGALGVHPLAELSVRLVDTDAMTALHEHWMDEPGPTDVMAFPMDELDPPRGDDDDVPPTLLGDVVLCPQVAQAQAPAGQSTQDELEMLCVHGVLHLLGYDHAEAEEQRAMFGTQDRLLRAWRATGSAG